MQRANLPEVPPDVVGLVLARPARMLAIEPFFMELVAGIEEVLGAVDMSLLLHVVHDLDAELATYRRWAANGTVGATVVTNVRTDDPRPAALRELGIPYVVAGGPRPDDDAPHVWIDNARPVRDVVAYLAGLGHGVIAHVTGPAVFAHTRTRTQAFAERCRSVGVEARTIEGEYTEESGARAVQELLGLDPQPTAVVFDNDVMAIGGLEQARSSGVDVPARLSVVAWDDSALCRLSSPPLSVMHHDVHGMGRLIGEAVLDAIGGAAPVTRTAPFPRLIVRGSTSSPAAVDPAAPAAVDPAAPAAVDPAAPAAENPDPDRGTVGP
ncbi:substrate-binding domain-containing protein [Isoptericola sp. NEAU-Y5]|uniref:Substrate-binding domain-containing protein n=1 Tax=Isoptericola luteus TaxID=2879484 RepID=A0ABS7ZFH5_9MICO|nr:substrate-binding domain-containing protein [Isoptericola sp. NEAU-Y5]MCA5893775.1 substrate-binding domain-containing protein [Isoptericola sp. NEAU-Y5]